MLMAVENGTRLAALTGTYKMALKKIIWSVCDRSKILACVHVLGTSFMILSLKSSQRILLW